MELDDALLIHASPNSIDDLQRNASGLVTALDDIEDSAGAAGRSKIGSGGCANEDVPRKQRAESVALPHSRYQRRKPLLPQVEIGPALRARLRVQQ